MKHQTIHEREFLEWLRGERKKYGLADAVSTGPATQEEIMAAWVAMGKPQTHEQWLKQVQETEG